MEIRLRIALKSRIFMVIRQEYAKTVDLVKKPFLASTVLVNTAQLVYKHCSKQSAATTTYDGQVFGDFQCNKTNAVDDFIEYLGGIVSVSKILSLEY